MAIGLLFIEMGIPFSYSLKAKRSAIKPLIHRLHKEFNISACEFAHQDKEDLTMIGCSMISNSKVFIEQEYARIILFLTRSFSDLEINNFSTEYI